jgi:steroid delta-isomerase-like uncharacterized protein
MTRAEIATLFEQHLEAWHRRDVGTLVNDHTEDGVVESPFGGGLARGRDAIEKVYRSFFHTFPDVTLHADEPLIDGDRVVLIGRLSGTDGGGFLGGAPTGRRFDIPLVCLYDIENGQIARERRIYDFTGMAVQVGAIKAKPVE